MKNNFRLLKRKMIITAVLMPVLSLTIGALILFVFIDGIIQAPFADIFVYSVRDILGISETRAIYIYTSIFRNYKELWMLAGYVAIATIVCYRAFSVFIRYFTEINNGIDRLAEDGDNEIVLSHEMDYLEKKLNKVKSTLKKRELDAQNAEQRKNDLVVYLAHDIKTPLTSVIGYLSLLDEAADMPAEQKSKYVKITLDKAFRLEKLINEFFEITRYNLQTILLDKQDIDLNYMLLQMADELYPLLTPTGKSVHVHMEDQIHIYGDPDKLARVFNNIIKNAIAYGYPDSVIEISAEYQGSNIRITFANKGAAIPKHKLDTIFDKFFRLDDARSSNLGGAGLGLAIAKSIITAHEGSISVISNDEITEFSVTLPMKITSDAHSVTDVQ